MSIGPVGGHQTPQGAQRLEKDVTSFLQGQTVVGRVMQAGAGGAMVQVGARLFSLPADASMAVGQQLSLLVKEGGPNPLLIPVSRDAVRVGGTGAEDAELEQMLRSLGLPVDPFHKDALRQLLSSGRPVAGELLRQLAMNSPSRLRLGSQQVETDEALARLLDSCDLPDDESHLFAARALMARGLPLTREGIEGLARTLARLGATTEFDFEAAAQLKATGLPVTSSTLELAKAEMGEPQGLGRQLHTVRTLLAMLAEALEASSVKGGAEGSEMERLVEQSAQQLSERVLLAEGEDRSRLVASLQRLARDQGSSLENRLARVLVGKTDPKELQSDLRVLLGRLVETAQRVGSQAGEQGELRRVTTLLRETAGELAGGLMAQQLKNAGQQGPERWFSLQLPFSEKAGDYPRTAELRIGREPGREIDAEHARLVFRLEMERLKTVEVRLQIVGKQISCSLATDSEHTVPLLQGEFTSLQSALQGLGYSVAPSAVGMLAQGEDESSAPEIPDQLLRIDYRA